MPTSLPLVFDPPRRAMPPRHFADLDEAGRARRRRGARPAHISRQTAGQPVLRPVHRRPARDDRPARRGARAGRRGVVPATARRRPGDRVRRGGDPEDAVARGRRHDLRVGADALSAAQHRVHLVTGGMRDGVPVLRDGPGRAETQPVHGRDSGTGPCRGGGTARPRRGWDCARRPSCRTSSSWAWASRWPTTTACWRRFVASPHRRRTALASPRGR